MRFILVIAVALALFAPAAVAQQMEIRPGAKMPERKTSTFPAPDDVAEPPAEATTMESGLSWKRLGEADGEGDPPGPNDRVGVRYTGWQTDGTMFDTTETNEVARYFRVNGVIAGFEEAVQLLRIGEKARFWVPESLAYQGRAGKPAGMLVFDLTLTDIKRGPRQPESLDPDPEQSTTTDSGLIWQRMKAGEADGESPKGEDTVLVHYSSWTEEGRLIDSTILRGEPQLYTLDRVIPGFLEAFSDMVPGEARRLWMTPELTTLEGETVHENKIIFDVELVSFLSKPERPLEVAAIPDDATVSATGVARRILRAGDGATPKMGDTVTVNYAGWTRDGKEFDSSYDHGRPGRFKLDHTKPLGWNEAVMAMQVGEKALVWIPEDMAYGGRSDRPKGMLVFEIELLSVEPAALDGDGATP